MVLKLRFGIWWIWTALPGLSFSCVPGEFFSFFFHFSLFHYCIVFIVAIIVCFHSSFVITLEMTPLLAGYSRFGVTPPFQFFFKVLLLRYGSSIYH